MENLNIRKLNYKEENFFSALNLFLFYGICRIDNIQVKEVTGALTQLGIDNFKIDKDVDNKSFVIEVKQLIKKAV